MRVDVSDIRVEEQDLFSRLAKFGIPLPEIAELGVPAWILVLKPLKVFLGLSFNPPEVDGPTNRKELSDFMDIILLGDPFPSCGYVIMMDLDAVFFHRKHVGPVIILIDPAMPHLGIAFLVLVTVRGAVFDERPDSGIDDRVVLPESILQIAFDQEMVLWFFQGGHH